MWSLLDADQVIPWADQRLKFHHKYRFWIQPYTKGYHTPLEYGNGAGFYLGTALSGSISTILTIWSWICAGIYMCGALPSPVCA